MNDKIADVIAEGREYIEKNGWWKNRLLGPNRKQACMLGGLLFSQSLGEQDLNTGSPRAVKVRLAMITVAQTIKKHMSGDYCPNDHDSDTITHWNDHFAKDKQEVLDVLAKAEKIERAGYDPDA